MASASEYRRRARVVLEGSIFSNSWIYMLVAILVVGVINSISSFIVIGPLLVTGPLAIGLASFTLHAVRGTANKNQLGCLFDGVANNLGDHVVLGLLNTIYTFLWSLLFIIPGIVKAYSYSMCYYIKCDNPGMSAGDCISESRRMMDGHKFELFCLDLSFLGWLIVGSLCCGVGTLWVSAYMQAARGAFYEDLKYRQGGSGYFGT